MLLYFEGVKHVKNEKKEKKNEGERGLLDSGSLEETFQV